MSSTLSYQSSPAVGGFMYESLPERLRQLAEEDGDMTAFVHYDGDFVRTSVSRRELYERSVALAKVLVTEGLTEKAAVCFCMVNSIDMLIANMAVICTGAIPFYMSTNLKDGSDVINVMNTMKCEMFFMDTNGDDANWRILENIWPLDSEKCTVIPSLRKVVCNGNIEEGAAHIMRLSSLLSKPTLPEVKLPTVQAEDAVAYFCSSGSTGKPKIITCSHFCIISSSQQMNFSLGISEKSTVFNDRTFSWVVGFPREYLADGATRVCVDPRTTSSGKHIKAVAEVIEREQCDVVYAPNYMAADLLDNLHLAETFSQVKAIIFSGERVPKSKRALKGLFCKELYVLYGTTEGGPITVYKDNDVDSFEDGIIGELRVHLFSHILY